MEFNILSLCWLVGSLYVKAKIPIKPGKQKIHASYLVETPQQVKCDNASHATSTRSVVCYAAKTGDSITYYDGGGGAKKVVRATQQCVHSYLNHLL